MVLIAQVSFTSCKKDGVYRPDEKIAAIYTSSYWVYGGETIMLSEKTLTEKWTWGKKDLEQITLHSGNTVFATLTFSYDKGKLSEIMTTGKNSSSKAVFSYKNSKLTRVENFEGSTLMYVYEVVEREKGKITKVEVSMDELINKSADAKILKEQMAIVSRFFFPENAFDQLFEILEKSDSKALGKPITITYTYSGDNIITSNMDGEIINYQHDTKNNPYYKSFYVENDIAFSKNNIVATTVGNSTTTYEYKYDNDWPIERTSKVSSMGATMYNATYYEYK